jgi:H+-translocating NAD(P) transhydrogenase subunit alpha
MNAPSAIIESPMALTIGVPKERFPGERRVAIVPDVVSKLVKEGFSLVVEQDAGQGIFASDEAYVESGARIAGREEVFSSDIVAGVQPPVEEDISLLRSGSVWVGFLNPLDQPRTAALFAAQGVTAFSMELVPRITRAQKMDALSAMSSIAGYHAVLVAAQRLPKFFPLLTTAAGTLRPASVLVLGAGVAGLQALATARRLGARVSAYDVRDAAREEVQSLGASFVDLEVDVREAEGTGGYASALPEEKQRRQAELLEPHVSASDVVISTALIPGRPAPLLITEAAVKGMKPGSVIIDMAAANGGNCALTRADQEVVVNQVTILGPTNLPASMAVHASQMYSRTVVALIGAFAGPEELRLNLDDEVIRGSCVAHAGAVVNERVASLLEPSGTSRPAVS